MRYVLGFVCVLALGLALMAGCSEENGEGGSGGTATLSILVVERLSEGGIQPLQGLQLCETDTANCATTDVGGNAALDLPVGREISYTMEKDGYLKALRADVLTADGSFVPTPVATNEQIKFQYDRVMSPYPMEGTGTIFAQAFSDELGVLPISGATFELVDTTGKGFFEDASGNWTLELTATTSQGSGGFVEVSPGEHELRVGGSVENCQVLRGWPSDSENTMSVPVREGYQTITRFYCPPE
jgi:hypothetical protein